MIDYWLWPPQLDHKQIKKINRFVEKNFDCYETADKEAATLEGESLKKASNVKIIYWKKIKHLLSTLYENGDYILTHNFGYLTFPYAHDRGVNLTTYNSKINAHYKWHKDKSPDGSNHDVKGTLLINVSEQSYKGGDLKLFTQGEQIVKDFSKPGSAILFNCFMNHEVTPVTKGERKTLAMFISGPKFR